MHPCQAFHMETTEQEGLVPRLLEQMPLEQTWYTSLDDLSICAFVLLGGLGVLALPSSMTRLKKVPTVKSARADVAGRWCSRYFGVSNTNGFTNGLHASLPSAPAISQNAQHFFSCSC